MSTATETGNGAAVPRWSGDARFDAFIGRRRDELVKVAVLLTGSRHDAEDAVQEAVLAVSRSWGRVLAGAADPVVYAYLRRAVVRKCIDLQRARLPLNEVPDRPVDDGNLLRFESDRRFFALLAGLPAQQRAVLVLRHYLDWDDARIASLLRVGRATVRSNAMRGLQKLRQQLEDEEKA